jgi:hypothetical protein
MMARRTPRYAEVSSSGTQTAPRRVTTVVIISSAGMLRQHAQGKISLANRFWERSMQFEKQLPGDRSFTLATRRGARTISLPSRHAAAEVDAVFAGRTTAAGPRVPPYYGIPRPRGEAWLTSDDRALRTQSEDDRSWRAIPAAISGLVAKGIAGLAACAEIMFPNFLFVVMSWTFAQALAGCAAYAQAMYPIFVDSGDPVHGSTQSSRENPNQLPSQTPGPSELSPRKDEIRGCGPIPLSRRGDHCE